MATITTNSGRTVRRYDPKTDAPGLHGVFGCIRPSETDPRFFLVTLADGRRLYRFPAKALRTYPAFVAELSLRGIYHECALSGRQDAEKKADWLFLVAEAIQRSRLFEA